MDKKQVAPCIFRIQQNLFYLDVQVAQVGRVREKFHGSLQMAKDRVAEIRRNMLEAKVKQRLRWVLCVAVRKFKIHANTPKNMLPQTKLRHLDRNPFVKKGMYGFNWNRPTERSSCLS